MHPATKNWIELVFSVFAAILFAYLCVDSASEQDWLWAAFELVFTGYWLNETAKRWNKV